MSKQHPLYEDLPTRRDWYEQIRRYERMQALPPGDEGLVVRFLYEWMVYPTLEDHQMLSASGLELFAPALLRLCARARGDGEHR